MKRLTTSEFITKAIEKHGNKYDYSKTNYINSRTNVTIFCKKHGAFEQPAKSHLKGSGCAICANRVPTNDEFIEKAKSVHGNKYDYSKVKYTEARNKIKIICPEHGEFQQTATIHLKGSGCLECGRKQIAKANRYSNQEQYNKQKEVLREFQHIHGNSYDYSKVKFTRIRDNIEVICKKHGSFFPSVKNHLNGSGCPVCGFAKIAKANSYTDSELLMRKKQVIKQFKSMHGNKYDYSKVKFTNTHAKVEIVCKKHGSFFQSVKHHSYGSECPTCAIGGFDPLKPAYLYVLEIVPYEKMSHLLDGFVGYGITNNPNERFTTHMRNLKKSHLKIKCQHLFYFESGYDALILESLIKKQRKASVSTPIIGFKTEAVHYSQKDKLLKSIIRKTQ